MTSISSKGESPATLILGVGNILMRDEGIGVRVIEAIEKRYRLPSHIRLLDGGTAGYTILDCMKGLERLVIVDAVRCGGMPGTIYRLTHEEIAGKEELKMSGHKIALPELLSLARNLGELPETTIVGVEPSDMSWGLELSEPLKAKIDQVIVAVLDKIGVNGNDFLSAPANMKTAV